MSNNEQAYGSQQPSTTNETPPTGVPDWLMAFMRSQQETNARLEQGIARLQSTTSNNNTPNSSVESPESHTAQSNTSMDYDNPTKKPKHSLTHPDKFTGDDESAFPQFKGLLEAKLEIDSRAIGTQKERVWYAFGRLTGKAAGRIYPWIEASKNTNDFTVSEFLKQLDSAFADPQKQSKALSKINWIRQGNRDFREFLREFDQTLLEAQGWKWEDQVRKGYLKAAINRELKDRLVGQEEPTLYSDYVSQLRRISDDLQDLKTWDSRRNRMPRTNAYTLSRDTIQPPVEAMEWEPTRTITAATGRGPPSRPRQGQHAASSSQVERQRRREKGACVRCDSMDHWVRDCPLLPPLTSRPQGRAAPTQAEPRMPTRKLQVSSTAPKSKSATVTAIEEVEEWETDEDSGKE
jgi:hypothetical protein